MRLIYTLFLASLAVLPAHAETLSEYTSLDASKDCSSNDGPTDPNEPGSDWASLVCNGWRGYPVSWAYGDARESVYFGFVITKGGNLTFQSFSGFNGAGKTIEWRIEKKGDVQRPFATILRWNVSIDPNDSTKTADVLVVSKVGWPTSPIGCVVGYVLASGDPLSNDKARKIADDNAAKFTCGKDTPVRLGNVPQPMSDVMDLEQ